MSTTYSTSLKLTLIGNGDQAGIWGQTTNNNLGTLLEQAITGVQSITMSDANYTLTNFNGVLNEARNAVLVVGGANNAQRDLIPPLVEKLYTVVNNTTGGFAIRVIGASGTGVIVPNGTACLVYCDGTNFYSGLSGTSGNFFVNGVVSATGNVTASGNVIASGNVTATNISGAGAAISAINASNISSGTIANARTTASSANGASTIVARDALGNFNGGIITGTFLVGDGSNVSNINATSISSGTVATSRISGSYTGITGVGNVTTGTWSANAVGAAYGGTGRTSLTAGNVILGNGTSGVNFVSPGTSGNYLRSNGTTWESAAPPGAEFSSGTRMTFNQTFAPTGWTKDISVNDAALRLTSGIVGSGGSIDFTTLFAASSSASPSGSVSTSISSISGSAGATTLSTPQIPSHSHPNGIINTGLAAQASNPAGYWQLTDTGNTGGGGSHTHPFSFSSGTASSSFSGSALNLEVKYVDLIIAQKN